MDFDKLIQDLLNQGMTIEDLGKQFADAANRVEAANNSKKKRDKYVDDLRAAAARDIAHDRFTFEVAARIATIATAEKYPDMETDALAEFCNATNYSLQETAKLQSGIKNGDNPFDALLDVLFTSLDKKDKDESDDEKISRFLRKLG